MKLDLKKAVKYAVLAVIILFVVIIYKEFSYEKKIYNRIYTTTSFLTTLRINILLFYEVHERYPNSLDELRRSLQANNNSELDELYVDLTSDMQRNVPEYRELNDKGGYYYDPNTGEIKLNLTRPVKEYLPEYYGRLKNDIPSEW